MARVLGLDLGSHTVRGVVVETSSRAAPQVRATAAVRRGEGERADTLRAALRELLANRELHSENVVVALSGPSLATHNLSLPFADAKRIEATVGFEIEAQLPFDLADAAFDYQIASRKENKSELLVGVVRKDELRDLLAGLAEGGVDPRIVTHPALVYQAVFLQDGVPQVGENEAIAIVDLGHERTSVCIGRPGAPAEAARTFPGGGKDLTRVLAGEFQTAPQDAEAWKDANGAIGAAAQGPEGERAAGAFQRGLSGVVRELRATLRSYSARSRKAVTQVYLCGGTARLAGLDAHLTQELAIPCAMLPLPAALEPAQAEAYALALRGTLTGAKAPRFNLRRGEFSFKGSFDFLRDRLGLIASYAATLIVLLIASMLVRSAVLSRRERAVDQALCDITQRVLGKCEKNFDRAISMLRGVESPAAVVPKLSAVNLLGQLTERIPSELPVTFDQIQIDLERVTLRGETDTSKTVDQITAALRAYPCFADVRQGRLERTRDGQKVTFRLDIQVECPGEATAAAAPQG